MCMQEISVITFHSAINYGSALQAYALNKVLSKKGYSVTYLNYQPFSQTFLYKLINNPYKYWKFTSGDKKLLLFCLVKSLLRDAYHFRFYKIIKNHRFKKYIKNNLKLSKRFTNTKNMSHLNSSLYIAGSDQIWNKNALGGKYDFAYFLDFVKGNKATYAVSSQDGNLDFDLVKDELLDFKLITVREEALKTCLENNGIKNVFKVCDPTLLLNADDYTFKNKIKMKNYILVYCLRSKSAFDVEKIASQFNLPIINVSPFKLKIKSKFIRTCGPEEFLTYIKNAKYVITNSFHAVCFSLIFKKNFYCLLRDIGDDRAATLLNDLDLSSRIIDADFDINQSQDIDYNVVEQKMNKIKETSMFYLDKICALGK